MYVLQTQYFNIVQLVNYKCTLKMHPRIPRGDSARYINIVDVAGEITPGYPRMLKMLGLYFYTPIQSVTYLAIF